MMDKTWLLEQLKDKIAGSAQVARVAASAAQGQADGASPADRRQDSRAALEHGRMASAQGRRAQEAEQALTALSRFKWPQIAGHDKRVALGSIVELEDDEGLGRTVFLAPVGAGTQLSGPGGDGFLTVVTPTSPLGRAIRGHLEGDDVDVIVKGEPRGWMITYVG
ncbi:MAG: GreA/GreB family elongation factor [Deltaproteobacteria bacterium]|nr:GreA/GreB family elongation factor [Deltaproteobacteria bacterium]